MSSGAVASSSGDSSNDQSPTVAAANADDDVGLDLTGIDGYQRPLHEPYDCPECGGPYVMDEDEDKVCHDCGLVSGVTTTEDDVDPHEEWMEHRKNDDEISGFYGSNRVRFPGGFTYPYFVDDEEDEYLSGA